MSGFTEAMATNPPRLVVLFQRAPNGDERFQWGVVGNIPILSLIAALTRVQADLIACDWIPECDGEVPAMVVAWDAQDRTISYYLHPDIPHDPLIGMMETIKHALVNSKLAQPHQSQRVQLLGSDGQPMRM